MLNRAVGGDRWSVEPHVDVPTGQWAFVDVSSQSSCCHIESLFHNIPGTDLSANIVQSTPKSGRGGGVGGWVSDSSGISRRK